MKSISDINRSTSVRIAVVQAAPEFLDKAGTVAKACRLIEDASSQGAELIAFGENFLPGHPVWFHTLPPTDSRSMSLASDLVRNAVTIPGPEFDALGAAARAANAMVVIGIVERPDPSVSVIYSTHLVINPDGSFAGKRSKIVPAVGERVFLTAGAGDSIRTFPSPWGPISVLGGGENSNPLLTSFARSMGARIHLALWPPHFHKPGTMHNVMSITGKAISYQNTAHVLAVAGCVDPSIGDRIAGGESGQALLDSMIDDPGSMIYGPPGTELAGPLHGEGILYADLDLNAGTWAQLVNRQYDRQDLLKLLVVQNRSSLAGLELVRDLDSPTEANKSDNSPIDRARRLIVDRFGDLLSDSDIDDLLPYVRSVLSRSARLAESNPTSPDPDSTFYSNT